MSRYSEPLMYIQSPFVILQDLVDEEESTAIFVMEEQEERGKESPIVEHKKVLPSVEKQLKKIQSSFGRHLYQPVSIKLVNDEEKFGTIEQVEKDQLSLVGSELEGQKIIIQNTDIIDILWRGKSIPGK